MKVVSNSTPLIALSRIDELDVLHSLFGSIIIPDAVYHEVVLEGVGRPGEREVKEASWIIKMPVHNLIAVSLLEPDLNKGEAEAVVLAKELSANYLLVDEKKARRVARASGIRIIGTAGIVGLAAKMGLLPDIDSIFNKLEQNGFRYTEAVKNMVKEESGK